MTLKRVVRYSIVAVACAGPAVHAQQPDVRTLAAQVCASCHGPRGRSISPVVPRLAGQRKEYLENQLKAFRDRTRADPMAQAYMWGMASQLSNETIPKIAAYYSEQKPVPGKAGDPKLIEAGRAIVQQGVPAANIPACVTCHGKDVEGTPECPRLAGQYAEYLLKQLVMFKSELRSGAKAPIMHNITIGMTFEQMQAVAAYLTSRPGS